MCMLRALESTWETHLGLTAVLLRPIEPTSPLGCLNARIQDLSRGTADMKLAGAAARVTWTDLLALAPGREDLNTLG